MDRIFCSWFNDNYHLLTNNGLWLRGGEINTLDVEEFDKRDFSVIITRLSTYWDTADSFTHKLLYQMITESGEIYADLAYLPPLTDADQFETAGVPWIIGTSSKRGAGFFDIIAISNSIVQEIVNIPVMLKKSGIHLRKSERMENESMPLVILGGANALYTSALNTPDPVVDGIFVGEDAELIQKLFIIARTCKHEKLSKRETLERMESVDGFYQPDTRKKTVKFVSESISSKNLMHSGPVMYVEEQMGRGNCTISEGCPCFCSFCAESWGRKPYREVSIDTIRAAVPKIKASMGLETLELYSFNFNMHRNFYQILSELTPKIASIGLKSQRFDMIAQEPEIIKYLHAVGKTSITCGLEGMSERIRKYLHKSLDEHALQNSLAILLHAPLRELKIFLICTGKETQEDYDEFCELLTHINELISMSGRKPRIIFSMTPLVRFPYTPLERENGADPAKCREIMLQTERYVRCRGFEFRDSADSNDYYLSQMLVRAQNPRVVNALFSALVHSKFVYYREVPSSLIQSVESEFKRARITREEALCGLTDETIENRSVEINVKNEFLQARGFDADAFEDDGYCLGLNEMKGECHSCGACESDQQIANITGVRKRHIVSPEFLRKKVKDRAESITVSLRIIVPFSSRGIPRKNTGIALARAMMLSDPRLIDPFHSYKSSLVNDTYENPWICGDDIISLDFHKSSRPLLDELLGDQLFIDKVNEKFTNWGKITGIAEDGLKCTEVVFDSLYPFDENGYFNKLSIKYTKRKVADNKHSYDLTKEALKKKIISSCTTTKNDNGVLVAIEPLEKFNCREFLSTAFVVTDPQERFRIGIRSVI